MSTRRFATETWPQALWQTLQRHPDISIIGLVAILTNTIIVLAALIQALDSLWLWAGIVGILLGAGLFRLGFVDRHSSEITGMTD